MKETCAQPKVSILVLAYEHAAYITDCLESLAALRYPNFEIVVLDDGSSDGTGDIARRIANQSYVPIEVIVQANTGHPGKNVQRLIDHTDAPYVMFMSGDDMLGPAFPLQNTIERLINDDSLGFVIPRQLELNENLLQWPGSIYHWDFVEALRSGDPDQMFQKHFYRQPSMIFLQGLIMRRDLIVNSGGFDTEITADDYAFVLRFFNEARRTKNRFWFNEGAFWIYRNHPTNLYKKKWRQMRAIFEVVSKYIPEEYWRDFDFLVMNGPEESFEDFERTQNLIAEVLGEAHRVPLSNRLAEMTIEYARERNDFKTLRSFRRAGNLSGEMRKYAHRANFRAKLKRSVDKFR